MGQDFSFCRDMLNQSEQGEFGRGGTRNMLDKSGEGQQGEVQNKKYALQPLSHTFQTLLEAGSSSSRRRRRRKPINEELKKKDQPPAEPAFYFTPHKFFPVVFCKCSIVYGAVQQQSLMTHFAVPLY